MSTQARERPSPIAEEVVEADIRLVAVRKTFGDVVAVDSIDLEIPRGEFFTMLGPSGSGKTTTLRLIAGFERPDSGQILLGGVDVAGMPPYERDVNTVFQDYALFPHMTVAENVEYGLRVKRVPKEERRTRVAEALATVRLPEFGARKPSQLSGGQQQRVALARALVNHPRVLLLDEPLGALDLKLREEMQIELKRIHQDVGITFVYVTHDQDEALTMSDRIAVFSHGRIDQVGTPVDVYERPATEFVAGFVGVSNMLERDERRFTVRPEKIRLLGAGEAAAPGEETESGVLREVIYLGSVTRYIVDLDAGGTLTVVRQNVEDVTEERGPPGASGLAARVHVRDRTTGGKGGHGMRGKVRRKHLGLAALVALVGALAFLAAGCGGDGDSSASGEDWQIEGLGSTLEEIQTHGEGRGRSEPRHLAWLCGQVLGRRVHDANRLQGQHERRRQLRRHGRPGRRPERTTASRFGRRELRLIAKGDAAPVNFDLTSNYADVFEALKHQPYNTVDGVGYGVPHGRGANVMVWRNDDLPADTDSWASIWDGDDFKGKLSIFDGVVFIADAALYLKETQPDLGIENPYELDEDQFNAVVDLLKQQRPNIGEYWDGITYAKQVTSFKSGESAVGTTWDYMVGLMGAEKPPVEVTSVVPKEGSTGWSDTWMIYSKAAHPNCMYLWMNYIISPEANAKVAEFFVEAPSNAKACDLTTDPISARRSTQMTTPIGRTSTTGHAAGGLRRQPWRGLQVVRGLARCLDRDQGLASFAR